MEGRGTLPTKRRQESNTGFYHVVVRGINNERIYNQHRERIYFKNIILKFLKKFQVEIYAFCIMSNHAHIMLRAELQELSMFMAAILAEYASYYNYKHYRNGHVFQNRFTSECIESEVYFWNCVRYIHMNPVKAGIVKNPLRYQYSSMKEYHINVPVVLHRNAFAVYEEKFENYNYFEEFHQHRSYEIFKDIPEEIKAQELETAIIILEEMCEKYDPEFKTEIFEQKRLREEYMSQIKDIMGVSKKKTKELYMMVRGIVENS